MRAGASGAREAGFTARAATVADAAELGRIHVQIWRDTYRGLMSDTVLDELDPVDRGERWAQIIASRLLPRGAHEPALTRVAVAPSGELVGFASVGASRDDDPPTEVELWALNVVAAQHGTGVADLLVEETLGDRAASLWVAEGNGRAIAYYRRLGFEPDGTTRPNPGLGVRELRMVRVSA